MKSYENCLNSFLKTVSELKQIPVTCEEILIRLKGIAKELRLYIITASKFKQHPTSNAGNHSKTKTGLMKFFIFSSATW